MPPSPLSSHQDLLLNTALFLRQHIPNGKVMIAPMDVYLDDVNAFQPDIFWLAAESNCDLREGYYYGAPELVVEILSPGNNKIELKNKYEVYEEVGVKEDWVIHPNEQTLLIYTLVSGKYQSSRLFVSGDTVNSECIEGFQLNLEEIFEG